MGRTRHIDHRNPPRSAGVPRVLRGGVPVEANPTTPYETEEVTHLRQALQTQEAAVATATERLQTAQTETAALKTVLETVREENAGLRKRLQEAEEAGWTADRIEVVTVNEQERGEDNVTLLALVDVDGSVGNATVLLPSLLFSEVSPAVDASACSPPGAQTYHGRALSYLEKGNQDDNDSYSIVPVLPDTDDTRNVPNRVNDSPATGGHDVPEVRDPPPRRRRRRRPPPT